MKDEIDGWIKPREKMSKMSVDSIGILILLIWVLFIICLSLGINRYVGHPVDAVETKVEELRHRYVTECENGGNTVVYYDSDSNKPYMCIKKDSIVNKY